MGSCLLHQLHLLLLLLTSLCRGQGEDPLLVNTADGPVRGGYRCLEMEIEIEMIKEDVVSDTPEAAPCTAASRVSPSRRRPWVRCGSPRPSPRRPGARSARRTAGWTSSARSTASSRTGRRGYGAQLDISTCLAVAIFPLTSYFKAPPQRLPVCCLSILLISG